MKRMTSMLRKFHLMKEQPESDSRQRLKKELFAYKTCGHHGFPSKPTAMAYDPILQLLAIGTTYGELRVYGSPGVQFAVCHIGEIGINRIYFLPTQGRLITLCSDSSLHLWQFVVTDDGSSVLEEVSGLSSDTSKLKKITACCAADDLDLVFVGTDAGNVHQVEVATLRLNDKVAIREFIVHSAPDDIKANPGHIVVIQRHPTKSSKLLLGFSRGLIVLWDLIAECADLTYVTTQNLESLSFCRHGNEFVSAHRDGSYIMWSTSDSSRPKEDPVTPYGPFPCKAIKKIQWKTAKKDPFIFFSGGMPRTSHGVRHTVSVLHGAEQHVVFDVTSRIVDFVVLSAADELSLSTDVDEPQTLLILAEEEFVAVDLLTDGWPLHRLPYLHSLHASTVLTASHVTAVPDVLWQRLLDVGAKQTHGFTAVEWPIRGGKVLKSTDKPSRDMLITGHDDGTVRFWDVSTPCMKLMYTLSTASIFGDDNMSSFEVTSNAGSDYEWPPFRRVGVFDPLGDDPQIGVQKVVLSCSDETLFVAGTTGHVIILQFDDCEQQREIEVLPVDLIPQQSQRLRRQRRPLRVKSGELNFVAGFQPVSVVQIHPSAVCTALVVSTSWDVLAAGTAHGFCVVNYRTERVIHSVSTLGPLASEEIAASLSRNRSLRKSLRASFRRLRSRSAAASRHDRAKSMIGSADGSIDVLGNTTPDDTLIASAIGSRSLESELDSDAVQIDPRPLTPLMLGCSSSRASLPTTSPPMTPKREISRTLDRRTAADTWTASIVKCLHFADTFITDGDQCLPTLWVGTSGGTVFVYRLAIDENEQLQQQQPGSMTLKCVLAKQIHTRHCLPVLSICVVDRSLQPLLGCIDVQQMASTSRQPDMTSGHQVIISTEDQLKIFSLPSLKVVGKCRMLSRSGVKVRKATLVEFRSRSDENYVENCVVCLTDAPEIHVTNLPHLRQQLKADCVRLVTSSPAASLFTRCGEAFLLQSPSEYVRLSLSARRVVCTRCAVDVADDTVSAGREPAAQRVNNRPATRPVANGDDRYAPDRSPSDDVGSEADASDSSRQPSASSSPAH